MKGSKSDQIDFNELKLFEETSTLLAISLPSPNINSESQPWKSSLSELSFYELNYLFYEEDEQKTSEPVRRHDKLLHLNCFTPQFKIYISHFLSAWGDRMWGFAGGLFLIEITPGSLRLVAVYHLTLSLTVIILGSAIGRWVDRSNRLTAVRISLAVQNLMVCLCAFLLCLLITYGSFFTSSLNGWAEVIAQAGVVFMACIAQIGNLGSKLSVEKDWVVVISKRKEAKLATLNSVLRTIDLSTQIMAPILVGLVAASFGMIVGGIVIASWNVVSLIIEYNLLHNLYYNIEGLRKPKLNKIVTGSSPKKSKFSGMKNKTKDAALMWKKYFVHQIKFAGLALAFLYMTVISFDNYTVAYLTDNGVSKWLLGILTACASVSGILGSITFPFLLKRFGTLKTGIFGYSFELSCLVFCVLAMFAPGTAFDPYALFSSNSYSFSSSSNLLPNNHSMAITSTSDESNYPTTITPPEIARDYTSVSLLLFGIISSRYGLWLADLTVTQILQEEVLETERGGINGVQYSLNQSLSLLRSILLIILPTMATFGYLVILSFIFVATAYFLFCVHARKRTKMAKQSRQLTDLDKEEQM